MSNIFKKLSSKTNFAQRLRRHMAHDPFKTNQFSILHPTRPFNPSVQGTFTNSE
jgi:hypothetical protein